MEGKGQSPPALLNYAAGHATMQATMMKSLMKPLPLLFCAAALFAATQTPAAAQETLKVAVPQRGAWDTSITEIGDRAGIFKKHNVNVELLFTGGGAEAQGAIISGQMDMAVSVGISTVLGIYAKGGPVRIFSAETTGQPDIYWFVPASSPVKTIADLAGKTMGYSVSGSSAMPPFLRSWRRRRSTPSQRRSAA